MTTGKKDIKVRPMTDSDLAAVNNVDTSIRGNTRVSTWPFSFATYWGIYKPEAKVFVAEIDGDVRGFISGSIENQHRSKSLVERPHEGGHTRGDERIGWVEMMGIHPDNWHMGIGTRLVEAFKAECKKNNARMRIIARDDDKDLASFLQSVGFKKSPMVTYDMPS
jgi:ribosomal protein S18 acetylase RimI-like enzyme